jgi:hypothetical protein
MCSWPALINEQGISVHAVIRKAEIEEIRQIFEDRHQSITSGVGSRGKAC